MEPLAIRSIKRFSLKKAWQSLISPPEDSEVEAEVLSGTLTRGRVKEVVPELNKVLTCGEKQAKRKDTCLREIMSLKEVFFKLWRFGGQSETE